MKTKHLKKTTNIYCINLFPKQNEINKLDKRFIQLTGECITRKATQEELDKYPNNIKKVDNYEELLYNIIYGEQITKIT